MGPIWDRQDPGGPHVGPMTFAFWVFDVNTSPQLMRPIIKWTPGNKHVGNFKQNTKFSNCFHIRKPFVKFGYFTHRPSCWRHIICRARIVIYNSRINHSTWSSLAEPKLAHCWLDPWEQMSMKFESKYNNFHTRKCMWKCQMQNGGYFAKPQFVKHCIWTLMPHYFFLTWYPHM